MRWGLALIAVICIAGSYAPTRADAKAAENSPPMIMNIVGIPDDGILTGPLNASVEWKDDDNDTVTVRWLLDGEQIGEGASITRYIYPGKKNLTVTLDDGNGGLASRSWTLDPAPPEGWDDGTDNTSNRIIFWTIFGLGGLFFAVVLVWYYLRITLGRGGDKK